MKKNLVNGMIETAHKSGEILLKYFGKSFKVREKRGAGLVSEADIASEESAIRMLKKLQPDFGVLAEESGAQEKEAGRWIIDPLDGTTNFVRGFPVFCVSIAAEWDGEVIVGVIYHPIMNETYVAIKNQGAFLNRKPIRVSSVKKLKDSLLSTGFSYRKGELNLEIDAFARLSKAAGAVRRPGSAALDLAFTARGIFDGFWERKLSPWDVAAGTLLVEEAGGKVTDFKGNRFKITHPEILASNSGIHNNLLKTIS